MTENSSNKKRKKTPWPTKAAMEQVYEMKLWGDNQTTFYSGEGSHHPDFVNPYIKAVISFLKQHNSALQVCDLGCGDFNIGKQLVHYTSRYTGVDIVSDLILHNKDTFRADNLIFECLDLAVDELPHGDCAILRQVLQHLSNSEIQNILNKLTMFKYVILTEHLPASHFSPNIDIISGQGIRLKNGSGVNILEPPFKFKVKEVSLLASLPLKDGKSVIVTNCYTLF
ncbi:class I SAM-dependent methyltransferase [Formosa sp. 3Alg 14/1]|uniref:class I SAM-dependent methyltransferase n=1 Tax=Formosa sp. 3Alg 14/1 TaxID=3382190 RepID=UPI0039BE6DB9